jgi:hypothetical protein
MVAAGMEADHLFDWKNSAIIDNRLFFLERQDPRKKKRRGKAMSGKDVNLSELLLQSVVDYAIYMLDREGRVVSWNSGAKRTKGIALGAVVVLLGAVVAAVGILPDAWRGPVLVAVICGRGGPWGAGDRRPGAQNPRGKQVARTVCK